jgi:hypothetical protein
MRKKNIVKRIYKPSTKEIFHSISDMPGWAEVLLKEKEGPWSGFLQWVLERGFFEGKKDLTIRKMAKDFGTDPAKLTKWISDIYNSIFDLNEEQADLFKADGIKHDLHASYFNNNIYATVWLLRTPLIYEGFTFSFFKARVGTSWFYVEDIHHTLTKGEHSIRVQLTGGILNRYREELLERARFEQLIDYSDIMNMGSWELDDNLRKWYK